MLKDKIRGSLIGGAAGDALGYAIEFLGEYEIFKRYGNSGIREYSLDSVSGKALISDDTQMTLFTAEGIINWCSGNERHRLEQLRFYENHAYQDWLTTQEISFEDSQYVMKNASETIPKGLMNVSELYSRRAPGITCLSALEKRKIQDRTNGSFIEDKINNSKGCGSVMRAAPVGFLNGHPIQEIDIESAEIAAITHCHSFGYMPAAVLSHVIHGIIYNDNQMTLKEIVEDARDAVAKIFKNDEHVDELINIINDAIDLSENNDSDLNNIHRLGEGWVSEEALAIALYCSLRYHYDFSECIIKAVNHKGDSDSTGAIAGNIIGAWLGYDEIESKWKDNLELEEVIVELANNLYNELINIQLYRVKLQNRPTFLPDGVFLPTNRDKSIIYMISRILNISVRIVLLNFIQFVICFFLGFILTGSNHIPFLAVQIAPISGSKNKALKAV